MLRRGYGTKQSVPQLILAGASVDDVYVIVLFTTFIGMMQGNGVSVLRFVNIPVSIGLGILIGWLSGRLLARYFEKVHLRDTLKILILLSWSFLLVSIEDALSTPLTFSALIAIMTIGVSLQKYKQEVSLRLSEKYNKLWVAAEVFLFVLVGATINIRYLGNMGASALFLLFGALLFRMIGVWVCLLGTAFTTREKIFSMRAYTPKATVQAAIGAIPLNLGLRCGDLILTMAVLAILLTAPLSAFAIGGSHKKLLTRSSVSFPKRGRSFSP